MATNEPRTFRKKPVVIEAMRLPEAYPEGVDPSTDDYKRNVDAAQVIHWLEKHLGRGFQPLSDSVPATGWSIDPRTGFVLIATLEGVMKAKPGDWIIRGVQGEFYPCKPDIFEATYVPCEPNEALPDDVLAEVDPAQLVKRLHAAEQELLRYQLTEITTAELDQIRHDIDKAQALVGALAAGDARWRMSIPADRERDSDLILTKALDAGEKATRQWQNALSRLEQVKSASTDDQKTGPVSRVFESAEKLYSYAENGHFNALALLREADGRAWIYFEGEDGPMCLRPWDEDEEALTDAKAGTHVVACFSEIDSFSYPVTVTVDYYAPEAPGV